jgi:hypothetical protein
MGRRRINPRLVKIHRNYTVEEIARLFSVHKNTVRYWLKDGLPLIDRQRPALVRGRDLREYHVARRKQHKQTCGPAEFYCVKCRMPKEPASGKVEYQPLNSTSGNLRGTCPTCRTAIYRRVGYTKLSTIGTYLAIQLAQAHRHIGDSSNLSLNCDSCQENESYAHA